jgi:ribose 5-phosphate isomerase B
MKIALAADHAGFQLKEDLRAKLEASGHEVIDLGTHSDDSTDYPDYAQVASEQVAHGEADRGILVCSTGVGMSIAANKVHGIRAALALNTETAELARKHNDANVLTLAAKFTKPDDAWQYVDKFLTTGFDGGRHARRVAKVQALENEPSQEQNENA